MAMIALDKVLIATDFSEPSHVAMVYGWRACSELRRS